MAENSQRQTGVLIADQTSELPARIPRAAQPTGPQTPKFVGITAVLCNARAAVSAMIVGVHGVTRACQSLGELPISPRVLPDAMQKLNGRAGLTPRRIVVVRDRNAVPVYELWHGHESRPVAHTIQWRDSDRPGARYRHHHETPHSFSLVLNLGNELAYVFVGEHDLSRDAYELRVATFRLARRMRTERAVDSMSDRQFAVLAVLQREGARTPTELAEHERVSGPAMTRTVNGLYENGYVTRSADDSDGRKVVVALTDAGRAVVSETTRRRDAWVESGLEGLTPEERATLKTAAEIMQRLVQR